MKRIFKSPSPKELTQWLKSQQKITQGKNCSYKDDLGTDIKAIVKQCLLEDQGYLCCYTGIRIDRAQSHIEHFKPQSRFFENHEDVDYNNLFAAFPGSDYEKKHGSCPFGAHARRDWYDEDQFISPLSSHCESAFHFNLNGEIQASPNNTAAKTTIDRLNLAHASLTEMRQQAIESLLFESEIGLKQAENLLEKIYDRNTKGQFRPFCFVLKQACQEYIRRGKQKQTRNKAIQSQGKRQKK
ncbi:MAG: TIGR02646 family protein [Cyanosarcina radialis HA8281-LM2]|jgi:uncharacterized protein (TIGR02646 family)|nr:TIGR02646 family protein [Cyanosarcina radialis HA8281-LM2]